MPPKSPADGPDHEGEVERAKGQRVKENVGLANGTQAGTVVELNVRQHQEEHDGENAERNQGAWIEQSLAKRRPRGRRLRRDGHRLHLGLQHIRDRPRGIALFGDLPAADDPLE